MTIERAIKVLERLQDPEPWEPQITSDTWQALDLAISYLERILDLKPLILKEVGNENNK